jgi:hypothetical protein
MGFSSPARRLGSTAVAAAVLFSSLCIVGVAAALQEITACPVWSNDVLSGVARCGLAATSLPSQ